MSEQKPLEVGNTPPTKQQGLAIPIPLSPQYNKGVDSNTPKRGETQGVVNTNRQDNDNGEKQENKTEQLVAITILDKLIENKLPNEPMVLKLPTLPTKMLHSDKNVTESSSRYKNELDMLHEIEEKKREILRKNVETLVEDSTKLVTELLKTYESLNSDTREIALEVFVKQQALTRQGLSTKELKDLASDYIGHSLELYEQLKNFGKLFEKYETTYLDLVDLNQNLSTLSEG